MPDHRAYASTRLRGPSRNATDLARVDRSWSLSLGRTSFRPTWNGRAAQVIGLRIARTARPTAAARRSAPAARWAHIFVDSDGG